MENKRRRPIRLPGYDYNQLGSYFLTVCTASRASILSEIIPGAKGVTVKLLRHGLVADRIIRQMDAYYSWMTVDKYVIMPDHIHILLTITDPKNTNAKANDIANSLIARFVGTFKRFCNKEYGENIWQARSYDHVIRN